MNTLFIIFITLSVICFIIEIATPGTFFFFSFAIGTLLSAFLSLTTQNLSLLIISASLISIITFFVLKKFDLFKLKNINPKTNIDSYIGKTAHVISSSDKNSCRVKIFGEEWNAICKENVSIGDAVEITGRESLVLYVKKI